MQFQWRTHSLYAVLGRIQKAAETTRRRAHTLSLSIHQDPFMIFLRDHFYGVSTLSIALLSHPYRATNEFRNANNY